LHLPDDVEAGRQDRLLSRTESEGPQEVFEARIRKGGVPFRARVRTMPLRDDHGQLVGFAMVFAEAELDPVG